MATDIPAYTQMHTDTYRDIVVDATVNNIDTADIATLFDVELDNSGNTVSSYFKAWDRATAPTVGTDEPHIILEVPAARKIPFNFGQFGQGLAIANNLYFICVTTGGVGGTTSPTNSVIATILAT